MVLLIVTVLLFSLLPTALHSQERVVRTEAQKEQRRVRLERNRQIQSSRIAFITASLSLTPKEAEQFWPLYNDYWNEKEKIRVKKRRAMRELKREFNSDKKIDEAKVKALINVYTSSGEEESKLYKSYHPRLAKIISTEKMGRLIIAENEFRSLILKHLNQPARDSSSRVLFLAPPKSTP